MSTQVVSIDEMKSFIIRAMVAAGGRGDHGHKLAQLLVTADHRGHFSHGLNRLGITLVFNNYTKIKNNNYCSNYYIDIKVNQNLQRNLFV